MVFFFFLRNYCNINFENLKTISLISSYDIRSIFSTMLIFLSDRLRRHFILIPIHLSTTISTQCCDVKTHACGASTPERGIHKEGETREEYRVYKHMTGWRGWIWRRRRRLGRSFHRNEVFLPLAETLERRYQLLSNALRERLVGFANISALRIQKKIQNVHPVVLENYSTLFNLRGEPKTLFMIATFASDRSRFFPSRVRNMQRSKKKFILLKYWSRERVA